MPLYVLIPDLIIVAGCFLVSVVVMNSGEGRPLAFHAQCQSNSLSDQIADFCEQGG
jgi:hypothetical protein